jgi:hypothetical protein
MQHAFRLGMMQYWMHVTKYMQTSNSYKMGLDHKTAPGKQLRFINPLTYQNTLLTKNVNKMQYNQAVQNRSCTQILHEYCNICIDESLLGVLVCVLKHREA